MTALRSIIVSSVFIVTLWYGLTLLDQLPDGSKIRPVLELYVLFAAGGATALAVGMFHVKDRGSRTRR